MDKELLELEAELKRLRPIAPSRELVAEISRTLAVQPRRINWWAWAAAPLAAAAAATVLLLRQPTVTPEVTPVAATPTHVAPAPAVVATAFKPVSADQTLYAQSDDGVVTLADGTSARRYRSSYVDTITWKDPRSQASLRWSVPHTEERVIPVSYQ